LRALSAVFFYGTLIAGSANAVARAAHRGLGPGVAARARGALYAVPDPLGWYPAMIAGDGVPGWGVVHGYVYPVLDGFDVGALDAYEGVDYRREAIEVQGIIAHAYIWAGALPSGAVLIPSGDFAAFAAEHGLAIYTP
jgi:gamma-glutamylcyclotransferase (GGCT)/AIG2-like uncharacterized protein YtfP